MTGMALGLQMALPVPTDVFLDIPVVKGGREGKQEPQGLAQDVLWLLGVGVVLLTKQPLCFHDQRHYKFLSSPLLSYLILSYFIFAYYVLCRYVCTCVLSCAYHGTPVKVREQLVGVDYLLPPWKFLD